MLFDKYEQRLMQNGLAAPGAALMASAENGELSFNRDAADISLLAPLFDKLQIKALIRVQPEEPYRSILDFLARPPAGTICPQDCETRLFLTDLPVAAEDSGEAFAKILSRRKSVIVPGNGIIAASSRSLREAFVTASSVCFACFVKFFTDLLQARKSGKESPESRRMLEYAVSVTTPPPQWEEGLCRGPFTGEEKIRAAICEAGKKIVALGLVDSCFGNISYCAKQTLYISRTGTFLDTLEDGITECPIKEAPENHPEASSELPAHLEILRRTDCRAILHGHPRFSVVLSMDCDIADCPHAGTCYRYCPYSRYACSDIPIVSGEVGGGKWGLCHTVPPVIREGQGVIVYGHGVFCCDETDFNRALARLAAIERRCYLRYLQLMELSP
ncbi:MAG: class II aldolase/adducin family protein [Desulfosalsimonadaceae bacterium]